MSLENYKEHELEITWAWITGGLTVSQIANPKVLDKWHCVSLLSLETIFKLFVTCITNFYGHDK